MINKHILTFGILLISSIGYSQYNYEVQLVSYNGLHPMEAFTIISEKLDYNSNNTNESKIIFESKYNYTEEKLRKIIEESGFELDSFTISKDIEKIMSIKR